MLELNKTYLCNCTDGMAKLDENSIDLTVTSPPYGSLRDYKGFHFPFEEIAQGLYRVTKVGGVVVWVVGDSVIDRSESGTAFRQALYFMSLGFKLHDTMIYEKNGPAFPARRTSNRYSQVFEYMFVFSKDRQPKTATLICDHANRWVGTVPFGKAEYRAKDGTLVERGAKPIPAFSARFNIWKINNGFGYTSKDKISFEHPATFPEALANDHIQTWSKEGDIVMDPMMGSGTVAKMALKNQRWFVGFEMSQEYCDIIDVRLRENFGIGNWIGQLPVEDDPMDNPENWSNIDDEGCK
jgi:site-specific DNA-methyltransferase (adenine-specific)